MIVRPSTSEIFRIIAAGKHLVVPPLLVQVVGLFEDKSTKRPTAYKDAVRLICAERNPIVVSQAVMACAVATPADFDQFMVELDLMIDRGQGNQDLIIGFTLGCIQADTWLCGVKELDYRSRECQVTSFLEDWVFFYQEGVSDRSLSKVISGELSNLIAPFVAQAATFPKRRRGLTYFLEGVRKKYPDKRLSRFGEAVVSEIEYKLFGFIPLDRKCSLLTLYLNDGGQLVVPQK